MRDPTTEADELCIDAIMRRWPATVRIFLRHRMHCVGCPVARFHTIRDACDAHQADETAFRAALGAAMASRPDRFSGDTPWARRTSP